ncbi:MAG TPA: helix-turn-helix transcriptional regulator [Solirubrobacteraceae bacterium]|nr:helix-turn-helix transcriptional regulator [Solirubrobacteraceae bacterium]
MTDAVEIFAANVRRTREARRLTQEELAYAADVHVTHLSKIERNECNPGARTVAKLMKGLQVAGGPLFEGIDGR